MPKVNVIIPSYNSASYLPATIQSVVDQTYVDWEAIVVDDGSTDCTREVAARFTDPRLRYIYQNNRGLSAARNTGIRQARGQYVALLDADDAWRPLFLETMLDLADQHPNAVGFYSGYQYMDERGQSLQMIFDRVVPPEGFQEEVNKGNWLSASATLVPRQRYLDSGLFDESLSGCADWDMWLRLADTGPLCGTAANLAWYRLHDHSMSTQADHMSADRLAVLTKHHGSEQAPVDTWSDTKRLAYGNAYLRAAMGYLATSDRTEAYDCVRRAIRYLDTRRYMDLFYQIACVHQPRAQRGTLEELDWERARADIHTTLAHLSVRTVSTRSAPRTALLDAYAAFGLALLAYNARYHHDARLFVWRALRSHPLLLATPAFVKLLLRSAAPRSLRDRIASFRQARGRATNL